MKSDAVVLCYQRPHNLPVIVANLLSFDCVQRVYIASNRGDVQCRKELQHLLHGDRVCVIEHDQNQWTWTRWQVMSRLDSDFVFTCDDDNLVYNWNELHAAATGTGRIATNHDEWHFNNYDRHFVHEMPNRRTCYEALVGWGACVPQHAIRKASEVIASLPHHQIDELLMRKADRIFTMLQYEPHEIINAVGKFKQLPGYDADNALYRSKSHKALNQQIRERVALWNREDADKSSSAT